MERYTPFLQNIERISHYHVIKKNLKFVPALQWTTWKGSWARFTLRNLRMRKSDFEKHIKKYLSEKNLYTLAISSFVRIREISKHVTSRVQTTAGQQSALDSKRKQLENHFQTLNNQNWNLFLPYPLVSHNTFQWRTLICSDLVHPNLPQKQTVSIGW